MKKNLKKPDIDTRTKGIGSLIKAEFRVKLSHQLIMSEDVEHYFSSPGDAGWGCGYRNLQMFCSYLLNFANFKKVLFGGCGYIPSVPVIQEWMEAAWVSGFDPEGAKIFNGKIQNTKALLGTTDIAALLRFFGVKMDIVDFFSVRLPDAVIELQKQQKPFPKRIIYYEPNQKLFDWVWLYFTKSKALYKQHKKKGKKFIAPLYLQHPGHSRTIIGATKNSKTGECFLLVFDPAHYGPAIKNNIRLGDYQALRLPLANFTHENYQIGFVCDSELMDKQQWQTSQQMQNLGDITLLS